MFLSPKPCLQLRAYPGRRASTPSVPGTFRGSRASELMTSALLVFMNADSARRTETLRLLILTRFTVGGLTRDSRVTLIFNKRDEEIHQTWLQAWWGH